jgi:CYTH domain-containing protein/predicted ATPase
MGKKSKPPKKSRPAKKSSRSCKVVTVKEYERRFLVTEIDDDIRRFPKVFIKQGYYDNLRIRNYDGKKFELICKTGHGRDREETSPEGRVNPKLGRFLLGKATHTIEKTRYRRDGWEVDFLEGPLHDIIIAEIEKPTLAELDRVTLPPWFKGVEVTGYLTNRVLAGFATDLRGETTHGPVHDLLVPDVPRIVLTGAPCSGKSSVLAALRKEFGDVLHCVPETATIVIDQVGCKPPVGNRFGMKQFQKRIYGIQLRFERAANDQALRDGRKALLLDRGTVDGAAYMEDGIVGMARDFRTTVAEEYERYEGVICLDVPPRAVYEANKANNAARSETYAQAVEVGRRLKDVWGGHPNFVAIRSCASWEEKLAKVRAALSRMLPRP